MPSQKLVEFENLFLSYIMRLDKQSKILKITVILYTRHIIIIHWSPMLHKHRRQDSIGSTIKFNVFKPTTVHQH